MSLELQISDNKIFAPLKGKELIMTPEEYVRQRYICRLVNHYGYSIEQMGQEVPLTGHSKRGTGRAYADIVVWRSKEDKLKKVNPIIVVECKADYITIKSEDYYQGQNYARFANAPFFVTTNEKETKVFKVNLAVTPKTLSDEILDIPNAKEAISNDKIKKLLEQTKAFERDEFSKLLFQCHNVIRNNDKLSPEAAFDEISKILFMKIRYERNPDEDNIFTLKQFERQETNYEKNIRPVNVKRNGKKDDIPYMDYWFELTKDEFEEDELFDVNDKIKIKQGSFKEIVKKLQKYNLSTTSDDVKGIAFEQFLGGTFRGQLGQYFTPRTVVDFIVEVLDPQEDEIMCDPCCGSGGFLIKAFEYVRAKIENDIKLEKDKVNKAFDELDVSKKEDEKLKENSNEIIKKLGYETQIRKREEQEKAKKKGKYISRLEKLSSACIFGTDANPRMSRTAKMNMIMHGDGHGGVHHRDGLLNINGIFENRFDVILTNPPFGARVEKSLLITKADQLTDEKRIAKYKEMYGDDIYTKAMLQVNNNIDKPLLDTLHIGKNGMSGLTEVLFIERCIRLLKPGGRLGIVLPEGVLNTQNLAKVREYFESTAKIILITSIPQDVFMKSGATVKSSLVFLKKFTEQESNQWKKYTTQATKKVKAKYKDDLEQIKTQLALRGADAPDTATKKELRQQKKKIETQIQAEIKAIVKEKFDYDIPIATVEKAGISSTGGVIDNELIGIKKEYTPYRLKNKLWQDLKPKFEYKWSSKTGKVERIKNNTKTQFNRMVTTTMQNINFIKFSELYNWSVQYLLDEQFSYNKDFPLVAIGKFLKRNKSSILVKNDKTYKRVKIKTNNGGVLLRNITKGDKIGTKKQFTVKKGQFIVSKIDARNGAFGVVTDEVDGAIITGNFWTFDVDYDLINPHYLSLITTTPEFIRFCEKSSTGTTNRHYLQQDLFLEVQIPLPPLNDADAIKKSLSTDITQEKLVVDYNLKIKKAEQAKQNAIDKEAEIETYLYNELGIQKAVKKEAKKGLHFVKFKDIEEWGFGRSTELLGLKSSIYEVTNLGKNEFLFTDLFRGKSPKYDNSKSYILNQKCIRWNYIEKQYMKSVKKEWLDKVDDKFLTKSGDILINSTGDGTIGRSTIVREETNLLYDSHVLLLRLNTDYIIPEYFVEIFNSNYGQKQIEAVKSAQSTKQTELGLTNLKKNIFSP